jgi:AcrR family transcriptional regulator
MSENTREKLLLTAMHLYGTQGIHAVSLRTISTEAGSRNSAAMHYHFKDKLGVIDALIGYIFDHLNEIGREQQLYARTRSCSSLNEAIKLCLLPLAELRRRYPWGNNALQLLSRLLAEGDDAVAAISNNHTRTFFQYADDYLARLLPELDPHTRQLRMMFMADNTFHGFAEVASLQRTPLGDLSQIGEEQLLDHLVDYLAGGLQA